MDTFLFHRELYGSKPKRTHLPSRGCTADFESNWINRLGVTNTLEDHGGCVNTLRWNNDGRLLASGSDDRHVIVWDVSGDKRCEISTNHDGNIFGVEFIPYGNDRIVATCAGDHMVKLHDLVKQEELHSYTADGRVKRLATAQDEPYLFWSAGEDGLVRQHDVRTSTIVGICQDPYAKNVKTIAICQGRTELLAAGITTYYVPIYDRRMIDDGKARRLLRCAAADYTTRCPRRSAFYSTHVAFDYYGRELIVNQNGGTSGGAVYTFNLNESERPTPTVQKLQSIIDGTYEIPIPMEEVELDKVFVELKNKAKFYMENSENRDFAKAIRLYTECIYGDFSITRGQRSILFGNRSVAQIAFNRQGDYYAALRDAIECILLNPSYTKGYWRLMKSLLLMEQPKLARDVLTAFKKRFPESKDLDQLEKQLKKGDKDDESLPYDLREVPAPMVDYEARFVGHKNLHTDIKEANFFGSNNQYIVSGSDCGSMIIWDRMSGLIKEVFAADDDILNIVQPHPDKFLIATSGIENCIRFWEPLPEGEEEPRRKTVDDIASNSRFDSIFYWQTLLHYGIQRANRGQSSSEEDAEEH